MSKFGCKFDEVWPEVSGNQTSIKLTDFARNALKNCENIPNLQNFEVDIGKFIVTSKNFPIEFPIDTCRVISQPWERSPIIKAEISSAYPIIHENVLGLYLAFLEHKLKFGNPIELKVYKDLTLIDFVQRLLTKRAASFCDEVDNYLLLTGEEGSGGFSKIGTEQETPPFTLENLLSYDEMKLSAFLSVSSHTEFINDGRRENMAKIEYGEREITRSGVVVGLIGGRFQRPYKMEYQDIVITEMQNTRENGYGPKATEQAEDGLDKERIVEMRRLWNEFYNESDLLYEDVANTECERFTQLPVGFDEPNRIFFDTVMMKKRYAISIDTFLLEADARAATAQKQAYVHVVGIGLGVWQLTREQDEIFLKTFEERIRVLLPQLLHISVIDFSWFKLMECGDLINGAFFTCEGHPDSGIRILLSKRNPSARLPLGSENMLLVVSYAWDSNSMPGNEFWMKCLGNSSDSATASSSLIAELHNPYINKDFVNGSNLHIATLHNGVMHIREYCKNVLRLF